MKATDPRVSYAELARWPDDGRRYELYGGEAIVVPSPNLRHQRIVANVLALLREFERRHGGGVVMAPFDIVLSDYDVLQPDVVYFAAGKFVTLDAADVAHVVPDLAVEVLSRGTEMRDRGRKMALLASFGLPEYWLVDPTHLRLEVFVHTSDSRLLPSGVHDAVQEFVSPALAGLRFKVGDLFED